MQLCSAELFAEKASTPAGEPAGLSSVDGAERKTAHNLYTERIRTDARDSMTAVRRLEHNVGLICANARALQLLLQSSARWRRGHCAPPES